MRSHIEKWLQQIWYSDRTPPWFLRMLVPLYRAGYKFDHRHDQKDSHQFGPSKIDSQTDLPGPNSNQLIRQTSLTDTPLMVVGNITVGGSGKTPLVIALCGIAGEMGLKAGIASRGYGRESSTVLQVDANSDTRECGDEPVLIAVRTGVPVVVANRRQDAIDQLGQMNLDVIISDDGLQTAGLFRHIEICVVDGERGIGNGYLLPAGPLREPAERLMDVEYVVSNGRWPSAPDGREICKMELTGERFWSLDGLKNLPARIFFDQHLNEQAERSVHLFAAIGNPDRFFNAVRQLALDLSANSGSDVHWHEHRLPDHHTYTASDFEMLPKGATIVMTEKDAVKCRRLNLENAWYLPVDAELDGDFVQSIRQQLQMLKQENPDVE